MDDEWTTGVLTDDHIPGANTAAINTTAGPWTLLDAPDEFSAYYGEISFGVSCLESVRLRFNVIGGGGLLITIRVNGGDPINLGVDSDEFTPYDLILPDAGCGHIVTVSTVSNGGDPFTGPVYATLEVLHVV